MDNNDLLTGVLIDESTTISFVDICRQCDVSEDTLVEMIEYGVIESEERDIKRAQFKYQALARVRSARRMQQDLDVNMPGIALALELLDKLEKMQDELNILQRFADEPSVSIKK